MKTIRFGLIGIGLMGKEFASALSRWCHLLDTPAKPQLTALCSAHPTPQRTAWYTDHFPTITHVTDDYRQLLENDDIDAIYCAVPHHLHQQLYTDIIAAGKHLLAEKPVGIDLPANNAILTAMHQHPHVTVRVASQYLYYPGMQHVLNQIEQNDFGRIIEIDSGFCHSSDLNPDKPINWKRVIDQNGEYGSMGDLGVHIAIPCARAGWQIANTRAVCSNIMPTRPESATSSKRVPCQTWDNANLLTVLRDTNTGDEFPWTLRVHRIMPGEMNSYYIAVYGTKRGVRFSLKNPRRLETFTYTGSQQSWQYTDLGYTPPYPSVTGGIFEFGASDAFLQLVAAFVYELVNQTPLSFAAACPTVAETNWAHQLFTAALASQKQQQTITL